LDNFPVQNSFNEMRSGAKKYRAKATDLGHGYARKAFVLCFFSLYILEWKKFWESPENKTPVSFFNDFYRRLNGKLHRCSYGLLYPAHPFDWLILKCVKALDNVDPQEDMDALELFNETLKLLALEQEYIMEGGD